MFRVIAVSAITAIGGVLAGTATDVLADPIVRTGEGSDNSTACPSGEGATAKGGETTAVGCQSVARAQRDTAVGYKAKAISTGGTAPGGSVAIGANSRADAVVGAVAIGEGAKALENEAVAIGGASRADALQGIAVGQRSEVTATRGLAIGTDAEATAKLGLAIGDQARAKHEGAVVIGIDADDQANESDRKNQFKLGQDDHTYTLPGITSDASKAAQEDSGSGEIEIVTTDQQGDLATISMSDIGASQQQVDQNTADIADNRDDIDTNTQGVAIAIAMEGPDLAGNETFAVAANWGTFEGVNAFAASATGVLSQDVFADGSGVRLSASGGIGYSPSQDGADDSVAARAGVQLSW